MSWFQPYQMPPNNLSNLPGLLSFLPRRGQRNAAHMQQPQPPVHLNQRYYTKRKEPRPAIEFNESEPHLKISYVKQSDHNHEEAYYITPQGYHFIMKADSVNTGYTTARRTQTLTTS